MRVLIGLTYEGTCPLLIHSSFLGIVLFDIKPSSTSTALQRFAQLDRVGP